MTLLDSAPLDVLDAYRTCEFVTLGRDGTPLAWPTAVRRQKDGTLLLSTSLAFSQKALNIRRDDRVALLFSDPTGSGLAHAPQIFVGGRAECPDEIMTGPQGAEDYWRMLFERQPHSRAYVTAPLRRLMDWYYLRLLITVTPDQLVVRPPLPRRPRGTLRGRVRCRARPNSPDSPRRCSPARRLRGTGARPDPARPDRRGLRGGGTRRLRGDRRSRLAPGAPARRAAQPHAQRPCTRHPDGRRPLAAGPHERGGAHGHGPSDRRDPGPAQHAPRHRPLSGASRARPPRVQWDDFKALAVSAKRT